MNIAPDTNVLVRAIVGDDPAQGRSAKEALASAERIVLALPALCELVWVLRRRYKRPRAEIAEAIRRLTGGGKVVTDRSAVEAGLDMLDAGGDFADGVIAHESTRLGADMLVSFDRNAVGLLSKRAVSARLLG